MRVPRRKHPVTEAEMIAFRTRLANPVSSAQQEVDTKEAATATRGVPIELSWWMQGGSGANRCLLFLPHALPEDRRDKTKIEIVP